MYSTIHFMKALGATSEDFERLGQLCDTTFVKIAAIGQALAFVCFGGRNWFV